MQQSDSSQHGAYPVLHDSSKSSKQESLPSENNSCYDEDDGERREHIARYTREALQEKMLSSGQRSVVFDVGSLNLDEGPQVFDKDSDEDNVRQQVFDVEESEADPNLLRVSSERHVKEAVLSEKSGLKSKDASSQILPDQQ